MRIIAASSVAWVIVGVPVAAIIAASRVFPWVIYSLPEMVVTATAAGAVQGLWLYLALRPSESNRSNLGWLGSLSGGILGILGFPPVFSRINSLVVDQTAAVVFLVAAISGGIVAGVASSRIVARLRRDCSVSLARSAVVGCAPIGFLFPAYRAR